MRILYFIFIYGLIVGSSISNFASAKKTVVKPPLLINGAGASFPYILYSTWFLEYRKINPNVMINYRSIGSGGGIRQFVRGTLDFGATDVPMLKSQHKKAKKNILHIPMALGAVVITYNLKGIKKPIRLTASLLADIYLGKITKWNHPSIYQINKGIVFPNQNIVPIFRADGSGTTAIFTEYLAEFSKEGLKKIGKGSSVNWQVGLGGKGNEGVMGLVQKIPGSIAYVSMSYVINRKGNMAEIQNKSGYFVKPNINTVKKAASQMLQQTQDIFKSLVVVTGKSVYPMSSYTYLLVHQKMYSVKGQALVDFLNWSMDKGQSFCEKKYYVPLPLKVIQLIKNKIKLIKVMRNDKKK